MFLELLGQFCNVTGAAGGSATCIRSAIRSVPWRHQSCVWNSCMSPDLCKGGSGQFYVPGRHWVSCRLFSELCRCCVDIPGALCSRNSPSAENLFIPWNRKCSWRLMFPCSFVDVCIFHLLACIIRFWLWCHLKTTQFKNVGTSEARLCAEHSSLFLRKWYRTQQVMTSTTNSATRSRRHFRNQLIPTLSTATSVTSDVTNIMTQNTATSVESDVTNVITQNAATSVTSDATKLTSLYTGTSLWC